MWKLNACNMLNVILNVFSKFYYKVEDIVMEVFREKELLVYCGFPLTSYDQAVSPPYLKPNGSILQVNQVCIQVWKSKCTRAELVSLEQVQMYYFEREWHYHWLPKQRYWFFHELQKEMATHSGTVAWKIPWMEEEPGRLQSMGSLRVRHDWFHFHAWEKEMATHSSALAWRIPGMGEPGGLWDRTELDTTETIQ